MPIPSHYIDSYRLKDNEDNKFIVSKNTNGFWIVTKNIGLGSGKFISVTGEEIVKFLVSIEKESSSMKAKKEHLNIFFKTPEDAYELLTEKYSIV